MQESTKTVFKTESTVATTKANIKKIELQIQLIFMNNLKQLASFAQSFNKVKTNDTTHVNKVNP